jgi:tetratricopeptide (TPR) repeat protein
LKAYSTQNALADGTYLNYIRAHYNRSKQIDPPFFQELLRPSKEKQLNYKTNLLSRAVVPLDRFFTANGDRIEKRRRTFTSWFTPQDFTDLPALTAKLNPSAVTRKGGTQDPLSRWIYDQLSQETKTLMDRAGDEASLRKALAKDLNQLIDRELAAREKAQSGLYAPERFAQIPLSPYLQKFVTENPQSHTRVRLNRLLLEEAYPKEIAKSIGGVYPDREIYIPTPEDSQRCFQEYLVDAQKRQQLNQLKPGEDVKVADGKVQVSGQIAVMQINGLLTKVIFDHNPDNEFFVEESFPLDWMYPYLLPYGIIMKINRQPMPSLTEEVLQKDHEFWKQFSRRLTGDIVDYGTPIKQITDWIEKTYVRRNFKGFTGDRKFVRDDDAQKAFSKLRSSIGGVYAWRLSPQCPPEYRPKNPEEQQRLLKEAEFAFLQAFSFCPYSPEALFRYANLLLQFGRIEDALLLAQTCIKLDPYNGQVTGLVSNLESYKGQQAGMSQAQGNLQKLETEVRKNPSNFQAAFNLANTYLQTQQTNRAIQIFDNMLNQPTLDPNAIIGIAKTYSQMGNVPKLEIALERLVTVMPANPDAWFDLAAMQAMIGKSTGALRSLEQALTLSTKRREQDPKARDLRTEVMRDPRFNVLRQMPEFQKLVF